MTATTPSNSRSRRFTRSMRLSGSRQFLAVLRGRIFCHAGPLIVYMAPNDQQVNRLGLSVSRRVGTAVRRNRIKRLLREAFRLHQHELPRHYDVVIRLKPHEPLGLDAYSDLLLSSVGKLENRCIRSTPTHDDPK